ncbi:HipA family kinase [Alicyclobacillus sp. ALC3]|uniref:HipA family kinase n=1 Tax=Alicyclobacillus sp. ALC3 TaxID=2796143 RepID=UPI002378AAE7|nr:HipA family kinase [Alicyclobacillus sp. ALC3]WDL98323.1 hypothetical protein JC200_06445 [Alicyclobacillus sp. ALC3]
MTTDQGTWRFERKLSAKLQGSVWIVTNPVEGTGFFKFATPDQWHYAGPYIANEWAAATLAKQLRFPVAKLDLAEVIGSDGLPRQGIVSVATQAAEITTWNQIGQIVRERPEEQVENIKRLRQLVVFDAWIANVDRAVGKNIVLYRRPGAQRYNWYLIDHALALLGAPYKWDEHDWSTAYWDKLWRYYHVPNGLLRIQSSWRVLEPMVERIEQMPVETIEEAVRSVPAGALSAPLQAEMIDLLLHRRARLRRIIRRWLAYSGVKEFGH